jgi:hypothetical protein
MARKRIIVTSESNSGRNNKFHDNYNGSDMSRALFVKQIEQGNYSNYHVRQINGVKTPVSNPNGREHDNLG